MLRPPHGLFLPTSSHPRLRPSSHAQTAQGGEPRDDPRTMARQVFILGEHRWGTGDGGGDVETFEEFEVDGRFLPPELMRVGMID